MHEFVDDLYELCETLSKDLRETNEKIDNAGGKLSGADLEYVDKLTHAIKSVKTTIAMAEAEDDGYSSEGRMGGQSYARGRNARRDSRGRYSREGNYMRDGYNRDGYMRDGYMRDGRYSRDGEMIDKLREAMEDAPDEKTKAEIKRLIDKMA